MSLAIHTFPVARDAHPLPVRGSVLLAEAVSSDETSFEIVEGLSETLIAQLRERSLDAGDEELKNTSDYERFGKGSYEDWYASKERTLFALVEKKSGVLAGLTWFGPKPLGRKSMKHLSETERAENKREIDSGNWHTIVYRSYAPFRGKGLMKDFVRFSMETYMARHPDGKMWAGIFAENPASAGLATALGFNVLEKEKTDTGEIIMVKE